MNVLKIWLARVDASAPDSIPASTHVADCSGLMAAATVTSLPVVVLAVLCQRRISARLTSGTVKG
jgi:ABC-type glycerol-3-phosphate transport system permease component